MAATRKTRELRDGTRRVSSQRAAWPFVVVPALLALAVYASAFTHGFIWDDPLVLEQLRAIHRVRDLVFLPDAVPKFYYRPFIFLTFLIDRALAGESAAWFHATVVFWHVLTTALVFLFARSLFGASHVAEAGIAALLFAVHPIHVESVAWIAGRSDVIATALVLIVLLLASRTDRAWTAWISGLVMLLALLSKEIAIAALMLVPAYDLCRERRLLWARYVPLVLATLAYSLLRYAALGSMAGGLPAETGPSALLGDAIAAVGWYASKLVLPLYQNAYVPEVPEGRLYPLLGIGVLVALSIALLWSWNAGHRTLIFLILFFLVGLAPSLMVIFRRSASALLAERYLYLPSVAYVIALAWAVIQLGALAVERRRYTVAIVAFLAVVGALKCTGRNRVWADDLAFWSDVAAKSPGHATPHRELANIYMNQNRLDEAERELLAAAAAKSDFEGRVMTYNNLGNLYLRQERLEEAARAFEEGLELYPHHFLYSGLGRLAMKRAELAQERAEQREVMTQVTAAKGFLEQALAREPRDYKSRVLLGQVLFSLGERDSAREHFETALKIEPHGSVSDVARSYLQKLR